MYTVKRLGCVCGLPFNKRVHDKSEFVKPSCRSMLSWIADQWRHGRNHALVNQRKNFPSTGSDCFVCVTSCDVTRLGQGKEINICHCMNWAEPWLGNVFSDWPKHDPIYEGINQHDLIHEGINYDYQACCSMRH